MTKKGTNKGLKINVSVMKNFLGGKVLTGKGITEQLPFIFFLCFLGIILISNRYCSEKTIRKMEVVQDSIKELKSEAILIESDLMRMNTPSEIEKRVKENGLNLIDPLEPPRELKVKKEKNKGNGNKE